MALRPQQAVLKLFREHGYEAATGRNRAITGVIELTLFRPDTGEGLIHRKEALCIALRSLS
jgi:hypothetical protein